MTCSVEGCEKLKFRRGWCEMHYTRWRKHGDVGEAAPKFQRAPRGPAVCTAEGCGRAIYGRGLCEMHYNRWSRNGDLALRRTGPPAGTTVLEVVGYGAAHERVRAVRGSAQNLDCVDCGGPAREWSYDHLDPGELVEDVRGSVLAFSLSVDRYQPRCKPCHWRFDHSG